MGGAPEWTVEVNDLLPDSRLLQSIGKYTCCKFLGLRLRTTPAEHSTSLLNGSGERHFKPEYFFPIEVGSRIT